MPPKPKGGTKPAAFIKAQEEAVNLLPRIEALRKKIDEWVTNGIGAVARTHIINAMFEEKDLLDLRDQLIRRYPKYAGIAEMQALATPAAQLSTSYGKLEAAVNKEFGLSLHSGSTREQIEDALDKGKGAMLLPSGSGSGSGSSSGPPPPAAGAGAGPPPPAAGAGAGAAPPPAAAAAAAAAAPNPDPDPELLNPTTDPEATSDKPVVVEEPAYTPISKAAISALDRMFEHPGMHKYRGNLQRGTFQKIRNLKDAPYNGQKFYKADLIRNEKENAKRKRSNYFKYDVDQDKIFKIRKVDIPRKRRKVTDAGDYERREMAAERLAGDEAPASDDQMTLEMSKEMKDSKKAKGDQYERQQGLLNAEAERREAGLAAQAAALAGGP